MFAAIPPTAAAAGMPMTPLRHESGWSTTISGALALRIALTALREAARTRMFWLLFGTFFICGLSTDGLVGIHFIPAASRSTGCRPSPCPTAWTGSRPCRRRCAGSGAGFGLTFGFGPEGAALVFCRVFCRVFCWVFCGHQVGAAVAAFGGSWSRDAWASYLPAFFAAGVFCLLAALVTLAIGRRFRSRPLEGVA